MKVNLAELVESMEMQMNEFLTLLNRTTGEIITVSISAYNKAEMLDDEEIEELSDWEQDEVKLALDVVIHSDNYVRIPDERDINEYRMMQRFCYFVDDRNDQDALFDAIEGRGAFRRFKDKVNELGLANQWYEFREECYKEVAIDFCELKEIPYQ